MASSRPGGPRDFADAVAALATAEVPAAVELDDLPAPVNLAPFAHAIGGAVPAVALTALTAPARPGPGGLLGPTGHLIDPPGPSGSSGPSSPSGPSAPAGQPGSPGGPGHDEVDLSGGRLVLLHRPGGHDEWRGAWRVVVLVEADLEAEIAEDPLLAGVAWSWLMDALADSGARYTAESGTVSRSSSLGFGGLSGRPATTAVEVRASWTPVAGPDGAIDFAAHLRAWCALMMMCAGLPPEHEGAASLHPAGARR
jgi:hypothetical protein